MSAVLGYLLALVVVTLVIKLLIPLAPRIGLVDRPGGHKHHEQEVPLLGGIGIYLALAGGIGVLETIDSEDSHVSTALLISTGLLFLVGLIDDMRPLSVKLRVIVQVFAALVMIEMGDVSLRNLGAILPGMGDVELGTFATPFTVVATIGVINAINMADGIDGLAGSLGVISLLGLTMVLWSAGGGNYLFLVVLLMGALSGFLVFNLRRIGRPTAQVFLGDAGSTVLGFLFTWILIAKSQGEYRAMQPVTALWILAVPLFDTVAAMVRRLWLRRSPFHPDKTHLHHLLLDAGFSVSAAVFVIVYLQMLLIGIGIMGLYFSVPEWLQLLLFLAFFVGYMYALARPWRLVPVLKRLRLVLAG